jgi:hypothetical protein
VTQTVIHLADESWPFDDEELTLKDAFKIKAASGLSLKGFLSGVQDMEPLALQSLIHFLRTRAGASIRLEDVDFRISDLGIEQVNTPADGADVDPLQSPAPTAVG